MLFSCRFISDKQAIPKLNIENSCDPNLAEDFQEGEFGLTQDQTRIELPRDS